ncbi:hypothetical protein Taro_031655 [Colocasia esculenta]|uniref:Eukaryotic translation initiation factor 4G n=1 Tax=Colocasia esculenta TaxID=4460 RepID=A0A843VQK5_COLES|nr:hypothetical protein [Colocasia esculenta]
MSLHQSRAEKSEAQVRKAGRFGSSGHQRGFSGGGGRGGGGGGGGGSAPPPLSSSSSSSSSNHLGHPPLLPNRSIKKSGNGQGGHSRVNQGGAGTEAGAHASSGGVHGVQDGGHARAPSHGASVGPPPTGAKPADSSVASNTRAFSKPPHPQSSAGDSDSAAPSTPTKGDASKTFIQFGSISPGFVNGVQIPVRTSSAPPNLDEQKRDQVRHDSFRAVPTGPLPSAPKPQSQQPKKELVSNHSAVGDSHPPSQTKRDIAVQAAAASSVPAQKSSVVPIPGMPMPMGFQQSQIPIQFGGPNPQMQSQSVTGSSLQIPVSLPVGSTQQVQQQIFVPNIPSHTFPQGMHQGLGFPSQIAPQLTSQIGNLRMGMPQQYPQQQDGKFGGMRKTVVKITHPDTREELRLDIKTDSYSDTGSLGQRLQHSSVPPQAQAVSSYAAGHQMNYYQPLPPGSYNPTPFFMQNPTSLSLTSTQMTGGTQATRYNYQVGQSGSFLNPPVLNHMPVSIARPQLHGISEPVNVDRSHDSHAVPIPVPSSSVQVTVKPPASGVPPVTVSKPINKEENPTLARHHGEGPASHQQRGGHERSSENSVQLPKSTSVPCGDTVSESQSSSTLVADTTKRMQLNMPLSAAPVSDSTTVISTSEGRKKDSFKRSDSLKDQQKKTIKKDIQQLQVDHQADASDSTTGTKMQSLRVVQENATSEPNVVCELRNFEDVHVRTGAGEQVAFPPTLTHPRVEHCTSSEALLSVTDGKAIPVSLETSGDILEKKASEDIPPSISTSSETSGDNLPPRESPSETSVSSDAEADGGMPKQFGVVHEDHSPLEFESKQEFVGGEGNKKVEISNDSSQDNSFEKEHLDPSTLGSSEVGDQIEGAAVARAGADTGKLEKAGESLPPPTKQEQNRTESETGQISEVSKEVVDLAKDLHKLGCVDRLATDVSKPEYVGLDDTSTSDALSKFSERDETSSTEGLNDKGVVTDSQESSLTASEAAVDSFEVRQKQEKVTEIANDSSGSSVSGTKEKPPAESARAKTTAAKKKKRKEVLSRADAAGTSFDLYMAYKGPEEKREAVITSESVEDSSATLTDVKELAVADIEKDSKLAQKEEQSKVELDDWEDAIDISSPNLKASDNGQPVHGKKMLDDEYTNAAASRKYSRDFLLTLREQCTDLPVGFEIGSDIADALMNIQASTPHISDREPFPSSGRVIDRPTVAIRDRRPVSNLDDDKWTKGSGSFGPGRDIRVDVGGFRAGQAVGHGVLRNPRGQAGPYAGGILSGPMQTMPSPGGISRSNADADRWQRGTGIQRGLIPSPQTPLQVMHKAEKKYEVGKISDEEESKQRQLKAILNKLTPQNFDRLFQQVKEVNIDNGGTLSGVISQIFDKALMEPTFCEMYANFCFHLAGALPDFSEDNEKITFKRLLLNKCQEEFERGEREENEANRDEEGEVKQSTEEREGKRIKARRRMLGNIRLIGELYKKRMLTERIMHECIKKLLGNYQDPDEENIEALCKLMSTIGEMIDHPKAKEHMDAYFDRMAKLSTNQKLSSRVRFMLRDSIDLRRNKWQQRRKVEGPKKIEEVHRDAAQERQAQASRLARGPSMGLSGRRGAPPADYGPRGTLLPSPSSQSIGALRSVPSQGRGFGTQDVRVEDRHSFESRAVSVPLPQRPIIDDSITLGPQGGLAKGMSTRGQPLMPTVPLADAPSSTGDSRRLVSGVNGFSSPSDWTSHSSREELMPRYMQDRYSGGSHDQLNTSSQDRNVYSGGRDLRNSDGAFDRSSVITPPGGRGQISSIGSQNTSSEARPLSEEHLREKSISAIREFYSAKDEKEVVLCVRELNTPGFYPAMVSLWVTDSFERKDVDRDSLAQLLIYLSKPRDSLLNQGQLVQGFESVLQTLEDAVNDAPRAGEFLGRIFAKVIIENVLSLREIGRLIREGGEEPGHLIDIGLASEVLGSTLEVIRTDKGEAILNEIRTSSSLQLEDFRPPHPMKAKKLEAFL